jgi:hypothetical protein
MVPPVGTPDAEAPAMIAEVGLTETGGLIHRFSVSVVSMTEIAVRSSCAR